MGIEPGTRLGPYEIVEAIGAGGMGEVYRAHDPRMDRFVAIKILPSSFSHHPDRLRRFELEARAAGSINHPNLITVFDAGMHQDTPFIVMEFLDGETLRAKIGRDQSGPWTGGRLPSGPRLSIRKATDYAVQIAKGLAAAHDRGIVHRDLKPDNVFVTRDGRVKILDFGLAKQLFAADEKTESGQTEVLETTPGAILGTIGYMSPEQLRGQLVDHRTDIFSLGAILFEMITGERAFSGPSAADTMSAILHAHPAETHTAAGDVSPALKGIIIRSLEKNREERFQSAGDLAFALEAVATSSNPADADRRPAKPGLRWRKMIIPLLVLVVFVAGMGLAWLLNRSKTGAEAPWHLRQLTFDPGLESDPRVFPDGRAFVFTSDRKGNRDIFFQRVDGGNPIDLTSDSSEDDFEPAISPDGQQIAFRSERDGGGIFVMGATGESVRRLTRVGFNPCWSPDGRAIAFATEDIQSPLARMSISQLWTVDVSSGVMKKISAGDAVQPDWSPDGKQIVYWAVQRPGSKRSLYTIPATGGKVTQLTDDRFVNWSPVWSPDGKSIVYSSDRGGSTNLWRIDVDRDDHPVGEPKPVTNSPQVNVSASFSKDGARLLFSSYTDQARLVRVALDPVSGRLTTPPQRVVSGSRAIYNADISPDGSMLVTNSYGSQEDLFIGTIGGTITRQLTNDAFKDRLPRWSPDGSRIVFFSDRKGKYDIWWIRPDGSGLEQVSASGAEGFLEPRWSNDGRKIVAYTTLGLRPATFDLTKPLPAQPQFLPAFPPQTGSFYVSSWSPDGKRLAGTIVRPDGSMKGIAIFSFDSNRYEIVAETGAYPQWLGDSRTLLFGLDSQLLVDVDTKVVRSIGRLPGIDPAFRFLPDTRSNYVYYATRPAEGDVWMLERNQ